jgi:hypothetical protein
MVRVDLAETSVHGMRRIVSPILQELRADLQLMLILSVVQMEHKLADGVHALASSGGSGRGPYDFAPAGGRSSTDGKKPISRCRTVLKRYRRPAIAK